MTQTVKTSSPFLLHKQQVPGISKKGSEMIDSNGGNVHCDSNVDKSTRNNDSNSQVSKVTQIVSLFSKESDSNDIPDSNGELMLM